MQHDSRIEGFIISCKAIGIPNTDIKWIENFADSTDYDEHKFAEKITRMYRYGFFANCAKKIKLVYGTHFPEYKNKLTSSKSN